MQSIYVGNLPYDATDADLRSKFERYGRVSAVTLMTDQSTGQPRGFGFVRMPSWEDAEEAVARLNGSELRGRRLRVDLANERHPGPSRGSSPSTISLLDKILATENGVTGRGWN